ncbi:hypothetical protein HKD37_04G010602 [Glycine soja]
MGLNPAPSFKKALSCQSQEPRTSQLAKARAADGSSSTSSLPQSIGKIWDLAMIEVPVEAIASLAQYYDQSCRCFTFGDFQLVPTIEEFEGILGCPLGGRKSYLFSGFYPSMERVAKVVKISTQELDQLKQNRNGVVGIPRQHLEERAEALANQGQWTSFIDILVLLVFRIILFPNMDRLVDIAAIDTFLAYHHSKESPVVAFLPDAYDTFNLRCEKKQCGNCLLYTRSLCMIGASVSWFPQWKEGGAEVLCLCGEFPNVPLMGTRGCINYNPILAIRQLGYLMRGHNRKRSSCFLLHGVAMKAMQKYFREFARTQGITWLSKLKISSGEEVEVLEESEEVQALKAELERTRVVKEKLMTTVTRVRKECDELRDVNMTTTEALE